MRGRGARTSRNVTKMLLSFGTRTSRHVAIAVWKSENKFSGCTVEMQCMYKSWADRIPILTSPAGTCTTTACACTHMVQSVCIVHMSVQHVFKFKVYIIVRFSSRRRRANMRVRIPSSHFISLTFCMSLSESCLHGHCHTALVLFTVYKNHFILYLNNHKTMNNHKGLNNPA